MGSTQMTLSGSVKAEASVTATKSFDLANGTVSLGKVFSFAVDSSAASKSSDLLWQDEGTLAAGATVTIDLAGTGTNDPKDYWGDDALFDRVHAVLISNTTAQAGAGQSVIEVGGGSDGAGTNAFDWFFGDSADTVEVSPGGFAAAVQGQDVGWTVTSGTADVLRLENKDASNQATYRIIVIGESVASAATTTTTAATTTTTT
ncbi:MAG: hypothetical protein J7M19_02685 [Planctomycetes bacterium]|nr:hypothetical protein [Planctomycetota bacterium]